MKNMPKLILGTKLGMSQIFNEKGRVIPVTVVACGPSHITQIKSAEKDGYTAFQVGSGKRKKMGKAAGGHARGGNFRWLREYRVPSGNGSPNQLDDVIDVSSFAEGERVRVTAISKGKGFQGVVKRWGFHGSPKTHGTKNTHRAPGAIGSGFPQHVRKGMRMAGRMGSGQVTTAMRVVKIDSSLGALLLSGPVPGGRGGLIEIRSST